MSWNCETKREKARVDDTHRNKFTKQTEQKHTTLSHTNTHTIFGPQPFVISEFRLISSFIFHFSFFPSFVSFFSLSLWLLFVCYCWAPFHFGCGQNKKNCKKTIFAAGYFWVESIFFESILNGIGYFRPESEKNSIIKQSQPKKGEKTHKCTFSWEKKKKKKIIFWMRILVSDVQLAHFRMVFRWSEYDTFLHVNTFWTKFMQNSWFDIVVFLYICELIKSCSSFKNHYER